ncbi:hypothetical protein ASC64_06635 [Nocardioides sp. Root122]|uniref:hypothetical protein n=1 Tax=Nocardioides TaxID=1839 RepID=UPI0007033164|nr:MULTISPECIES: hypothetical protein [Nocardioides]KQV69517.1 hypothetical protein ASC64_06635 [Nocardioides sp. Root122]MCK9824296.1 hypothetical protein [Nocardioides cavernae]
MGEALSEPVTVTAASTSITATAPTVVKARKKFVIRAHITDPSASLWGTNVLVSHTKRPLAGSGTIYPEDESATGMDVKVVVADYHGRWLPVGTHTLTVRFSGFDASNAPAESLPSTTTVRIKVTRRGPRRH